MSVIIKHDLERIIRMERTAVLVVNTYSRKGERLFFRAMDLLSAGGIGVAASYPVRDPARLPEVVREAIGRGHKLLIVGGGDGTVSAIVDHLAYREVALGLLPRGLGDELFLDGVRGPSIRGLGRMGFAVSPASPQPCQVSMVAQARSQDPPHPNDPAGDGMAGRHAPGWIVTLWGEEGVPRLAPSLPDFKPLSSPR